MRAIVFEVVAPDLSGVHGIGEVDDVRVSSRGLGHTARSAERIEVLRALPHLARSVHLLITDEQVRLPGRLLIVGIDLVPRVDGEDGDELRLLDGAAVLPVADVNHHRPHTSLRRVGDAVAHPEIVNAGIGMFVLAHVLGLRDVAHVDDHVLLATRDGEQVVVGGEYVMHATRELLIENRGDFRMRRNGQVENDDAIHPIRRAFARQHAVATIGRHGHVVDGTRIDLHRIGLDDVVHVGDVEHESVAVTTPRSDQGVVASVFPRPRPEI